MINIWYIQRKTVIDSANTRKIVWIINFISTFSLFLMTRINISVNWHKADYIHLGRTSLGLQACYLSLKKWSNSIHNASKALPLSSAPESCCAWRCVGSSKLLNCIFHSQGLSAALQQIEFPNIIIVTRGKVKKKSQAGILLANNETRGSDKYYLLSSYYYSQARIWLII